MRLQQPGLNETETFGGDQPPIITGRSCSPSRGDPLGADAVTRRSSGRVSAPALHAAPEMPSAPLNEEPGPASSSRANALCVHVFKVPEALRCYRCIAKAREAHGGHGASSESETQPLPRVRARLPGHRRPDEERVGGGELPHVAPSHRGELHPAGTALHSCFK